MNNEQFYQLIKLGLFKSVETVAQLTPKPTHQMNLARGFALIEQKRYSEALKVIEGIPHGILAPDDFNRLLEIKLECNINLNVPFKNLAIINSKDISGKQFNPKIDLLIAQTLVLSDPKPNPEHPAIKYFLKLLKLYPSAIELAEKLISIGASTTDILSQISNPIVKQYINSFVLTKNGNFRESISILEGILEQVPNSIPVLSRICVNAVQCSDMLTFDACSSRIPYDELDIIDLRAARLKQLRKTDELSNLVVAALNNNENSANAWLAFSHLLELNGDPQRALQTTRKALLLDRNSRRGYMRHGELRLQRNDIRKAHSAFIKAHAIHPGLDSYTSLVQCDYLLKDWDSAESIALTALNAYPQNGESGSYSIMLMGIAKKITQPKVAFDLFKKALEKSPENTDALSEIIDMRFKENDLDGAVSLLNQYKNDKCLLYYNIKMGEILAQKHEYNSALEYLEKALQIDNHSERARELHEQIEEMLRSVDMPEYEEDGISFS